jgi:predicted small lipoprotein YifL
MKKFFYCLICIVSVFAMTACGRDQQSSKPDKEKVAKKEAPAGQTTPPVSNGSDVPDGEKASIRVFRGKVAETMNASNYTYVRLDDGSGKEIWVAVPRTDLEVGEKVSFRGGDMMLENFKSKTLNRTFKTIIFATGITREDGQPAASGGKAATSGQTMTEGGGGASGGSAANVVPFDGLKVEKATVPDAYSVGEIFEKASLLDGKHVAVRGKVVKFSKNIMGKNWIHIQDGTGDPDKNTCDLVVTTMHTVETGDIVTVDGRVAAAKDFGFGYKYDVIVEDANVDSDEGVRNETK